MSNPTNTFAGVLDDGRDVLLEDWDGAFTLRVRELTGFQSWSAPIQLDRVIVDEVTA